MLQALQINKNDQQVLELRVISQVDLKRRLLRFRRIKVKKKLKNLQNSIKS